MQIPNIYCSPYSLGEITVTLPPDYGQIIAFKQRNALKLLLNIQKNGCNILHAYGWSDLALFSDFRKATHFC